MDLSICLCFCCLILHLAGQDAELNKALVSFQSAACGGKGEGRTDVTGEGGGVVDAATELILFDQVTVGLLKTLQTQICAVALHQCHINLRRSCTA